MGSYRPLLKKFFMYKFIRYVDDIFLNLFENVYEFNVTDSLVFELSSQLFTNVTRCSGKANKRRYTSYIT